MRDDLVQQLGQVLQSQGYHVEPYVAHDIARAVLACGLVVPTSDVLNLAQQWEQEDRRINHLHRTTRAAELRALTQQELR